jgi:hypothetical protein
MNDRLKKIEVEANNLINKNPKLNLLLDDWAEFYEENTKLYRNKSTEVFKKADIVQRYLFSQIEEIHKYAYNASFELILFVKYLETSDVFFFTPRFFFINATFKIMGAWDRLIKFLGIIYDIEFSKNPKKKYF